MPYGQQNPYYGMQPPYTPPPVQAPIQPPVQPPVGVAGEAGGINVPGMLPIEESYIENILRLNKGKLVEVFTTFENNREWNAKVFKGLIEAAGRDHLILSDPQTGDRYLIPMVYVDYVTFNEPIDYEYQFPGAVARYAPR
ncbi:spore coat protein GerQ [Bacillus norwichensis]|uniref:Spore coat protein GerQ n=1 Tax=Bacillus norwichensis TaxID=2762217 RepID=A0ABR8VI16_9BACI|nr:spore coat protein GerQ [Bacillus norwichensis]